MIIKQYDDKFQLINTEVLKCNKNKAKDIQFNYY